MSCRKKHADRFKIFFAVLVLLTLGSGFGCRSTLPGPGIPASVTLKRTLDIKVKGRQRNYLVHVPGHYSAEHAYPLVVVIHGAFGTAAEMEKRTGFSRLADRERFIVVYPNGAYGILGFLQHWNAGFCCGKAADDKLDDVGFLQAVIRDVGNAYRIDRSRVYMTGFSNGGMLTYLFAETHPEILAAAAPLGAAVGGRASDKDPDWVVPEPSRPVPLLIMHGVNDQNVPFRGGISPVYGGTREFWPVEKAVDLWGRFNHCLPDPAVDSLNRGAVERKTWQGPPEGSAPVILYTLQGWEHKWPGPYFTAKLPAGDPLYLFDAAEIVWAFFRQFSR